MIKKIRIRGYRKYVDFTLKPNPGMNIIVGGNESGKSTLLEAIGLALTGKVNGRRAQDELNPHWFNNSMVSGFLAARASGLKPTPPEICIELFLSDDDELQRLSGAVNSSIPTEVAPGVSISIGPNPEYAAEIETYLAAGGSRLLPVEYYRIEWRSFADELLTSRPKGLTSALIDSRTVRTSSGMDFHLRQILRDHLDSAEKAVVSLAYRKVKDEMSTTTLRTINSKIAKVHAELHDGVLGLSMDQSSRTSWESSITPHVDEVPFAMTGQGQQAAIKIALAMNRTATSTNIVMIEEPENHLSHTSLNKLVSRIKELSGEHQQLFITTHSSFVLNRLGLDALLLVSGGHHTRLGSLDPSTVSYFEKLPGYDTLRLALADKIVLVEGPSDEIVFERFYMDLFKHRPIEDGIDIVSMRGLSLARCLELCAALDKTVAATRDNDGKDPASLSVGLEKWLTEGKRQLFIGAVDRGETLEPQLIKHNNAETIRSMLKITDKANLSTWMSNNKTEAAIRIAKSEDILNAPLYIQEASKFIHDA